jgi:hypothetical protein
MVKDLFESHLPILKIDGGLAEVLYLLLLLAVLAVLVLEFLLKEGVFGQGFLELRLQPLHRNGVTLSHPLECGLQLGSICMVETIAEYWSASTKVLNLPKAKESYRYSQAVSVDLPSANSCPPAPSLVSGRPGLGPPQIFYNSVKTLLYVSHS